MANGPLATPNLGEAGTSFAQLVPEKIADPNAGNVFKVAVEQTTKAGLDVFGAALLSQQGSQLQEIADDALAQQFAANQTAVDNDASLRELMLAQQQGRIDRSQVELEARAVLQKNINLAPGFSKQLKGQAVNILGFDPSGSALGDAIRANSRTSGGTGQDDIDFRVKQDQELFSRIANTPGQSHLAVFDDPNDVMSFNANATRRMIAQQDAHKASIEETKRLLEQQRVTSEQAAVQMATDISALHAPVITQQMRQFSDLAATDTGASGDALAPGVTDQFEQMRAQSLQLIDQARQDYISQFATLPQTQQTTAALQKQLNLLDQYQKIVSTKDLSSLSKLSAQAEALATKVSLDKAASDQLFRVIAPTLSVISDNNPHIASAIAEDILLDESTLVQQQLTARVQGGEPLSPLESIQLEVLELGNTLQGDQDLVKQRLTQLGILSVDQQRELSQVPQQDAKTMFKSGIRSVTTQYAIDPNQATDTEVSSWGTNMRRSVVYFNDLDSKEYPNMVKQLANPRFPEYLDMVKSVNTTDYNTIGQQSLTIADNALNSPADGALPAIASDMNKKSVNENIEMIADLNTGTVTFASKIEKEEIARQAGTFFAVAPGIPALAPVQAQRNLDKRAEEVNNAVAALHSLQDFDNQLEGKTPGEILGLVLSGSSVDPRNITVVGGDLNNDSE